MEPSARLRAAMKMDLIRPFLSASQIGAMAEGTRGSDGDFFLGKFLELGTLIENMPATYAQSGAGDQTVMYLHYFLGDCHWYICEKDVEDGVSQASGYGMLHGDLECAEMGYVSITELITCGAQLDLHFVPATLGAVKADLERRYGAPGPSAGR